MKLLTILLTLGVLTNLHAQTSPALDAALKRDFSEKATKDGRWVYYPDKANIEKLEKPLVKSVLPNYDIYKVTLTNYLGYHVNQGTCVVLFDSIKSKTVLVEPGWYSGISEPLTRLALKKQFDSKEKLLSFLNELNEILETGSGYKFVNTGFSDTLITYDLVYSKGSSITTKGNGTSSTISYTKDEVWRQIEIRVKDLKMIECTSVNPALKGNKEYKDSYKKTIK